MRLFVDRAEVCGADVRVDLRRRQTLVPQQFLDAADVGPAVQEVRGEGVPQGVGTGAGVEGGGLDVFFEQPPDAPSRQSLSKSIGEHGGLAGPLERRMADS